MKDIYYDKGKVKRYVRNVKSTKGSRTIETVQIGLSKFSEFEDGEDVVIIRKTDFENLLKNEKPSAIADNQFSLNQLMQAYEDNDRLRKQKMKLESKIVSSMNRSFEDFVGEVEKLSDGIFQKVNLDQDANFENFSANLQDKVNIYNENLSDAGLFKLWRYREDFLLNESDFNVQGALITNDYKSKFSSEIRKLKDKRLSDFSFDNLLED